MPIRPCLRRLGAVAPLVGCAVFAGSAQAAPADRAFALSTGSLLEFNPATPTVTKATLITGVGLGETIVGIDVRPQDRQLYALGVDLATDTATLYRLNPDTGGATIVGANDSVAFTTNGTTAVDLPNPITTGYGFDFNPAADRIRVSAGTLNFRLNPTNGAPVDGDNSGTTTGTVMGTNPDGPINGGATAVDGSAYTNSVAGTTVTTLYALDGGTDRLYIQNPPNPGTLTLGQSITLSGANLNFTTIGGFDIDAEVGAGANNAPVTAGSGVAVLNVGGVTGLYRINLVNGQATLVGNVGTGALPVQALALQPPLAPAPRPSIPPPPARETTRPTVTGLKITSAKKRKLTISFTASEAGTAKVRLLRETKGRRRGGKCRRTASRGRRCTVRKSYGTIARRVGAAGRVTVTVRGRVARRTLALGRVRVEVKFTDRAGNTLRKTAVKRGTVRK